ncbi:unnamed protein product, partial [Prorocentrum cordatum]
RPAGGGRDPGVAPVGRGGPRGRGVGRPPAGRGMRQDHAGVQGQGGAAEAQLDRRDVPGRRGGERGPRRRDRGRSGAHPRLVRWQGPGGRRQPGGRPGPGRRVHIEGGENYKLDKADAVLSRCGPHVSRRGGVWMVKWLNHVSTVRMKQNRHLEALEMLYDLELYSPYSPEEAPEFFETLYRNLAWAHKALGQIDEAVVYFERMARSSKAHKGSMDWFDCWDIGKLAATRGYRDKDMTCRSSTRAVHWSSGRWTCTRRRSPRTWSCGRRSTTRWRSATSGSRFCQGGRPRCRTCPTRRRRSWQAVGSLLHRSGSFRTG